MNQLVTFQAAGISGWVVALVATVLPLSLVQISFLFQCLPLHYQKNSICWLEDRRMTGDHLANFVQPEKVKVIVMQWKRQLFVTTNMSKRSSLCGGAWHHFNWPCNLYSQSSTRKEGKHWVLHRFWFADAISQRRRQQFWLYCVFYFISLTWVILFRWPFPTGLDSILPF